MLGAIATTACCPTAVVVELDRNTETQQVLRRAASQAGSRLLGYVARSSAVRGRVPRAMVQLGRRCCRDDGWWSLFGGSSLFVRSGIGEHLSERG